MPERDGFILRDIETGEEVGFIECSNVGTNRKQVEAGLVRRTEGRLLIVDTREVSDV